VRSAELPAYNALFAAFAHFAAIFGECTRIFPQTTRRA
jgi:hypothetical protein